MLIVGGSDRHKIEYSKGIRSLQSRIEAQALLGLSVCVGENRSFKAFKPIAKALKVLINRALGLIGIHLNNRIKLKFIDFNYCGFKTRKGIFQRFKPKAI